MPHADSSYLPSTVKTKSDLWSHIHAQLEILLEGQRNWVSNCANASSLIYNSLLSFPEFGSNDRMVNWCGFYIDSILFPTPRLSLSKQKNGFGDAHSDRLLLGPFCGRPACQFINTTPGKARGVCSDAFLQKQTVLVLDVDAYPGHIACDGDTKSEVVCPLLLDGRVVGVLDLDCLTLGGFDDQDKAGLEKIAKLIVDSSDW